MNTPDDARVDPNFICILSVVEKASAFNALRVGEAEGGVLEGGVDRQALEKAWKWAVHLARTLQDSKLWVFKINDYDWYLAENLEQAIELAMKDSGCSRDELVECPHKLTIRDMFWLQFYPEDRDRPEGGSWSFAEELVCRLNAGICGEATPGFFAIND